MNKHDADAYYTKHYAGPAPEEWKKWYQSNAWPSMERRTKNLNAYSINDGHGIVYRLLEPHAPFRSLLDIGCSAGDFLVPFTRASERIYGLDIAAFPGAWDVLRENYGIVCCQHDIDALNLPFEDSSLCAVTMIMVLEHVFDVNRLGFNSPQLAANIGE